ncbi:acyl carrier protein [Allocatelliglobosispora scoriae]|uniref:Acyl carrier protein n=1 Tax=Allocatelliglobosispora scoriae TaxID=643052 RepID=A0A841BIE9_9ACTN|nr:acyl carrier protein [Allocatelliglobosispora scoriae]MBB5868897.1 acyl carrier protein [Allocatelliglobosispora scoriae]
MNPDQLRHRLAELVAAASDGDVRVEDALASSAGLAELGLGSLGHLRLVDAVEAEFDVQLDTAGDLHALDSIDQLAAYLAGPAKAAS